MSNSTNFNTPTVFIVPLEGETNTGISSSFIKIVKEKENFVLYSLSEDPLYFTLSYKGCTNQEELLYSGNLTKTTNYKFIPERDGEYAIRYTTSNEEEREHIFTHYPYLTASFIKDLERLLCDCGCDDNNEDDCRDAKGKRCIEFQNIYGEMLLLFGLSRTLSSCNSSYNVLYQALYNSLALYRCELYSLFCAKQLDIKLKDNSVYNESMLKKIASIIYLLLYFYEKEISNQEKEYLDFVDKKYNYKVIKKCVLKTEIDILEIEHLFMSAYYEGCTENGTCTFGCIIYEDNVFNKQFDFELNVLINGIYDTVNLKNVCGTTELFVNKLLYKDNDVSVLVKSATGVNPTQVLPGEIIPVNVVIRGSKAVYSVINVPFIIDGVTIGTYKLVFSKQDEETNTPPEITNIIKNLENGEVYNFTVADFENHFTDVDGDTLDIIVLVGDTSKFSLDGAAYISGTLITRNNINKLKFTAGTSNDPQQLVLKWKAYDNRGAESN